LLIGFAVGIFECSGDGLSVGSRVDSLLGVNVVLHVDFNVASMMGPFKGSSIGSYVGTQVGSAVGVTLGFQVGSSLGLCEGVLLSVKTRR